MGGGCLGNGGAIDAVPPPPTSGTVATTAGDVTLTGRVTLTYGPHVFALGSGAEQVVVVVSRPLSVTAGSDVEVTGRVRTFRRAELETELGVDLGPQVEPLEEKDCLLATAARVR